MRLVNYTGSIPYTSSILTAYALPGVTCFVSPPFTVTRKSLLSFSHMRLHLSLNVPPTKLRVHETLDTTQVSSFIRIPKVLSHIKF